MSSFNLSSICSRFSALSDNVRVVFAAAQSRKTKGLVLIKTSGIRTVNTGYQDATISPGSRSSLMGSSRRHNQTAELGLRGFSVTSTDPLRSTEEPLPLTLTLLSRRSRAGISSGRHPRSDKTDLTPESVG